MYHSRLIMHFCTNCNNMYYIKTNGNDNNELLYYCRNCGHENTDLTEENVCVVKTHFKKNKQKYSHIINEYTKLDPTLPRINTVECPNAGCSSKDAGEEKEVIYIRYDETGMKYVYLCAKCDAVWKIE